MNSRDRVVESLNHRSGPLAVDFGSSPTTGIHVSVVAALREHFGLSRDPVPVTEPYQMLGEVDDDLADALHVDVAGVPGPKTMFGFANEAWKEWRTPWGQEVLVPGGFEVDHLPDGSVEIYPKGDRTAPPSGRMASGAYFFDSIIRQPPFQEEDLTAEDNLQEFSPLSNDEIDYYRRQAHAAEQSQRARMFVLPGTALGDIALVPAPFEPHPKGIRDVTEWYISTVMRRELVNEIFTRQVEIATENLQRVHDAVGEVPDVAFVCGTDFGTQTSQFCSPEAFDDLWAPHYARINGWIHEHTTWKTLKHCCGAIVPLLDRLIACGFDVVNPVQTTAAGMERAMLKERFGERVVFWGGGIDTQKILPFGTPDEVRNEARANIETFSKSGGFVFNTIHNVQAKTPLENLLALVEVVGEYR